MIILKKRSLSICIRRTGKSGEGEILLVNPGPNQRLALPSSPIWEGETDEETLNRILTHRLGVPMGYFFVEEAIGNSCYLVWVHPSKLSSIGDIREGFPHLIWHKVDSCKRKNVNYDVWRVFKEKSKWLRSKVSMVPKKDIDEGGKEKGGRTFLRLVIRKADKENEPKVLVIYQPPNWSLPYLELNSIEEPGPEEIKKLLEKYGLSSNNITEIKPLPESLHYIPGNAKEEVTRIRFYGFLVLVHNISSLISPNITFRPWREIWNGKDPYNNIVEDEKKITNFLITLPSIESESTEGRLLFHTKSDVGHLLSLPSFEGGEHENKSEQMMKDILCQPEEVSPGGPPYGYSVAEENLPPMVFECISPTNGLPTRYIIYPQKLWVDMNHFDISHSVNPQWTIPLSQVAWRKRKEETAEIKGGLNQRVVALSFQDITDPAHYQMRKEISPISLAILENLYYTHHDILLQEYEIRPKMEYLAHRILARAPEGCRILKENDLKTIMECGEHRLDLRVNKPLETYHRQSGGFTLSFFTPKESQEIQVYTNQHCTLYGLLQGEAELWIKPMVWLEPEAWQNKEIKGETWIEIEGSYCHMFRFKSEHGWAILVQSVTEPGYEHRKNCSHCHMRTRCQKPPLLRHAEWEADKDSKAPAF